jgi:hypothetical protein
MARARDRDVVRITDAQGSLSEDIESRRRRYLISMTIRVVCFVSAGFAHGWLRWVFVAGAVFIPYFAVVIANAGRNLRAAAPLPPVLRQEPALSTGPIDRGPATADPATAQWASHTSGSLVHDRTSSGS